MHLSQNQQILPIHGPNNLCTYGHSVIGTRVDIEMFVTIIPNLKYSTYSRSEIQNRFSECEDCQNLLYLIPVRFFRRESALPFARFCDFDGGFQLRRCYQFRFGMFFTMSTLSASESAQLSWHEMADSVLNGQTLSRDDAMRILRSDDDDLLTILDTAYRVRRQYFGKTVQLYYLKNAKSGLCPEDCTYCSQSKISEAPIEKYAMLNAERLLDGARKAAESKSRTYCIVASGRGPSDREVDHVASVVKQIKDQYGLHICCCLGLLKPEQAVKLKEAGVDRVNHNLNTSERFHDEICTTHTFKDRLETLDICRNAGLELCAGMIVGMGEVHDDVVDVAVKLAELNVESIPINFLNSIDGTPLQSVHELDARFCLKVLAMFRLTNPKAELRIAGGREVNLRSMQAMGLYPANSMFVSDYLTTPGQKAEEDFRMIADLGFEITAGDYESSKLLESWKKS